MTDLALKWTLDGGDLLIQNGDLVMDNTLVTPVLASLFTDRRAETDELPPGETDPRGWWGDAYSSAAAPMGSKLWLLERGKQSIATLADAEKYATEALEWMVDSQLVSRIQVDASYSKAGRMRFKITLDTPKNKAAENRYPYRVTREMNGTSLNLIETATGTVLEIEA